MQIKRQIIYILIITVIVNILGNFIYKRFDLTQDKRYTLSNSAKETIINIDTPIFIDVFLNGDLPPEFKKLKVETKQILEEFEAFNPNIKFKFVNPLNRSGETKSLLKIGAKPVQVEIKQNGKISIQQIFPWAVASFKGDYLKIPLLKNQLGLTSEERITNSIQNLEYAFANSFNQLTNPKNRKVAVLRGNGELDDKFLADFFSTLSDYYYVAPFTLDSLSNSPTKTLEQIKEFDLLVIARPTKKFTEREKYLLDQYIMSGGATLWLIDMVKFVNSSVGDNNFAFARDLNLTDFFFRYGIRINSNLVKDLYSAPILVASGEDRESQYNQYPWFYNPLSKSNSNHPITTNIEGVKFEYASSIDTLPNTIKKTILLNSSPLSKIIGLPKEINISKEITTNLKIVNEGPTDLEFNKGELPLAVLLEGAFKSAYLNRVKPLKIKKHQEIGQEAKMVIIGDGNIIKNQLQGNRPLELGFDKWTNNFYGNKEFLLNTVNYLLDDNGLINIRTKDISIPFLDPIKVSENRTFWKWINLLFPILTLTIVILIFNYFKKKKYT